MIIFGMLALGQAMDTSGASMLIANAMTQLVQQLVPQFDFQAICMLALVYLITSTFIEFLSNNAGWL